jgi:hypothetical protein
MRPSDPDQRTLERVAAPNAGSGAKRQTRWLDVVAIVLGLLAILGIVTLPSAGQSGPNAFASESPSAPAFPFFSPINPDIVMVRSER